MDKRYQVFLSSTYVDLKDERDAVTRALMEMDCIPAGMEAFPAVDDEQLDFIKKVIDDCDYYVLLIGGRYGSISDEGISYTKREYEYAIEKGIPVLAFLRNDLGKLAVEKTDEDQNKKLLLEQFREEVSNGRIVKYWNDPKTLPGDVVLSLNKAIRMFPAVGWVRGDNLSSNEILQELATTRKQNDVLVKRISETAGVAIAGLTLDDLNATLSVTGTYQQRFGSRSNYSTYTWDAELTYKQIFKDLCPDLAESLNVDTASTIIAKRYSQQFDESDENTNLFNVDRDPMSSIRVQFEALGLIKVFTSKTVGGNSGTFWQLTQLGKNLMFQLRSVKVEPKNDK